jgi:hypothetical protein
VAPVKPAAQAQRPSSRHTPPLRQPPLEHTSVFWGQGREKVGGAAGGRQGPGACRGRTSRGLQGCAPGRELAAAPFPSVDRSRVDWGSHPSLDLDLIKCRPIPPSLPAPPHTRATPSSPPAHSLRCRWCRGSRACTHTFWWPRCMCLGRTRGTKLQGGEGGGGNGGFRGGNGAAGDALRCRARCRLWERPPDRRLCMPQPPCPRPPHTPVTLVCARGALIAGAAAVARVRAHALAAVGAGRVARSGVDTLWQRRAGCGVGSEAGGAGLAAVAGVGGAHAGVAAWGGGGAERGGVGTERRIEGRRSGSRRKASGGGGSRGGGGGNCHCRSERGVCPTTRRHTASPPAPPSARRRAKTHVSAPSPQGSRWQPCGPPP